MYHNKKKSEMSDVRFLILVKLSFKLILKRITFVS